MFTNEQKIALGLRLTEERKRLNLKRIELARLIGCTPLSFANYENGKSVPGGEFIAALNENGIDIIYVLSGSRRASISTQRDLFQVAFLEVSRQSKLNNQQLTDVDHIDKAWVLFDAMTSPLSHVGTARNLITHSE
jgi:transcriptional regulator with XRE-family HTH domain